MTPEAKPSEAALRAAEKICSSHYAPYLHPVEVAKLIDRETHLPELIEALRDCANRLSGAPRGYFRQISDEELVKSADKALKFVAT